MSEEAKELPVNPNPAPEAPKGSNSTAKGLLKEMVGEENADKLFKEQPIPALGGITAERAEKDGRAAELEELYREEVDDSFS